MTRTRNNYALWALVIITVTTSVTDNMMKTFILLHLIHQGRWLSGFATLSFVLPYLFLSPLSGNLGDHFPRTTLLRYYKYSELAVVILSCISIITNQTGLMLTALMLFGVQITLISPVKLALLPDLVPQRSLVSANGLLDGTAFMAILIGTALAGLVSPYLICLMMCGSTLSGLIASHLLRSPSQGKQPIRFHWFASMRHTLSITYHSGKMPVTLLLSFFWGLASLLITLIPFFIHQLAHTTTLPFSEEKTASLLMVVTTLTLGIGSLSAGHFPNKWAITNGVFVIMCASSIGFLFNLSWKADFIFLGFSGLMAGLCSSQLYTRLIEHTDGNTSTICAGNNILNALAMSIASLLLIL